MLVEKRLRIPHGAGEESLLNIEREFLVIDRQDVLLQHPGKPIHDADGHDEQDDRRQEGKPVSQDDVIDEKPRDERLRKGKKPVEDDEGRAQGPLFPVSAEERDRSRRSTLTEGYCFPPASGSSGRVAVRQGASEICEPALQ